MKVFNTLDIRIDQPTAVAVGYFDGVHRGHQSVIQAALNQRKNGLSPAVFSFYLNGTGPQSKKEALLLTSPTQKEAFLRAMGVELLFVPPFSAFMGLSPEQYALTLLKEVFHARVVCCGYDYRFGKGAAGGSDELEALLAPHGIQVIQVPAVTHQGQPVSSTRIRGLLQAGDMPAAAQLLGRPFAVDFIVSRGKQLGSRLGFPTANQVFLPHYLAPRFGVYATRVTVGESTHPAVTNVGVKPTVGSDAIAAESFILDYTGDLYGQVIRTEFLQFLRDEQRFPSVEDLRIAIANDAETARRLHQQHDAI